MLYDLEHYLVPLVVDDLFVGKHQVLRFHCLLEFLRVPRVPHHVVCKVSLAILSQQVLQGNSQVLCVVYCIDDVGADDKVELVCLGEVVRVASPLEVLRSHLLRYLVHLYVFPD